MRFRNYQADIYDDQSIVVRNPETGQLVLLSDEEASALRYMESIKVESVLDILLPEAGIAKKDHIRASLSAIAKMKRAGLLDLPASDGRIKSSTLTMELEVSREKIRFTGLDSMAATIGGLIGRIFASLRPPGILIFTAAAAGFGISFFPFRSQELFLGAGPGYSSLLLNTYLVACSALSFRSVLHSRKRPHAAIYLVGAPLKKH